MRQRDAFTAGARFHSYHITKNKRYDCKPLICQVLEFQLGMALGEKLFEETGKVTGFKVTKVHTIEGVTTELSFTSDIRGIGRFRVVKILARV